MTRKSKNSKKISVFFRVLSWLFVDDHFHLRIVTINQFRFLSIVLKHESSYRHKSELWVFGVPLTFSTEVLVSEMKGHRIENEQFFLSPFNSESN